MSIALCAASRMHAQARPQPELRVDVLGPRPYSAQPGVGVTVAAGHYARITGVVGFAAQRDTNAIEDRWRGDLLGRFVFDPFRQHRWGFSAGGGLSIRRRTYIVAIAEVESPEAGGWMLALQAGVSGGLRAGLLARRAVERRR